MDSFQTHTLPNGLRLVHIPTGGLVSYIGVDIDAGSRDETEDRHGLAHFVEHTLFKGTEKRRSWQISSRMETIGGDLNAFTTKEDTMVYTSAPQGYEDRAFELLADLIGSSTFPSPDIDREREVVIEEINSYLDSPADSVFDDFDDLAYAGSGLAHNILGTPGSVRSLTGGDCREFVGTLYTPGQMTAYCCSPLAPEKALRLCERHLGALSRHDSSRLRTAPPPAAPFDIVRDNGNHQANTIVGARTFGRNDPRRHALYLLNNHLGGPSMNSRLNRELREKRGLVYAVDSNVSLLSDTGLMTVYFGCDPANTERCRRIVAEEIDRLAQGHVSQQALEKIKRQYCGQLLLTSDHKENRAMALAKGILTQGRAFTIEEIAESIRSVTPSQFADAARMLLDNGLNRLTIQ